MTPKFKVHDIVICIKTVKSFSVADWFSGTKSGITVKIGTISVVEGVYLNGGIALSFGIEYVENYFWHPVGHFLKIGEL